LTTPLDRLYKYFYENAYYIQLISLERRNMKQLSSVVTLLVAVLFASGCATHSDWTKYEMCFGLSADSGRTQISEGQWQEFQDDMIITNFPDGFTIYTANGYWRSVGQEYHEPSRILMVVAHDRENIREKLNAIAKAYALRFRQEAVLEISSSVAIDFHAQSSPSDPKTNPR